MDSAKALTLFIFTLLIGAICVFEGLGWKWLIETTSRNLADLTFFELLVSIPLLLFLIIGIILAIIAIAASIGVILDDY